MGSTKTSTRLTSPQRIARGLKYSTVGPVHLTTGTLGVGANSVRSTASWVGNRYRRGKIKAQLSKDLAAAQDVVSSLPQTLQQAGKSKRRRPRPVVLIGAGAALLAVGAVTFSIVRRSTQPDPSPLQPSVDVGPKP